MLSAGFVGGAYWSTQYLPVPNPLPFGSSVYSLISLVQPHDGSDASSHFATHGFLLEENQLGLLVLAPFHPALGIDG
jgi:hypothetical protein